MLKHNYLTLTFLLMASLLAAQVSVSGTVSFASEDANQPIPYWQVDFYMGAGGYVGSATTDENGDYRIEVETTFPGQSPYFVQAVDLCTGNLISNEWEPDADVSEYVANLILCEGVDYPDTTNVCGAYFFWEQPQADDDGFVVNFFDVSFPADAVHSWEWSFGDGHSSTERNPVHTYETAGDYLVRLTINAGTEAMSCTNTIEEVVVIWDENDCDCPTDEYDPVCVDSASGEVLEFVTACFAECAGYGPEQYEVCENDCECPWFYAPVCVVTADGETLTFNNHCLAECAGYGPEHWLDCEPNGCDCPTVYEPVCVEVSPTAPVIVFDNACLAECAGFAPGDYQDCDSECICPEFYQPVCVILDSGDTLTFDNYCFAQCEGYGPEQWVDCSDNCDCPTDEYIPVCVATPGGLILTFTSPCYAECAGYGPDVYYHCNDCFCPEYEEPVCVITSSGDTLTFSNPCFAQCEGFGPDQYFYCFPDDCICPEIYDPVCVAGISGIITFQNACYAECAGFTENDFVDCEPNCVCPFVWIPVCVLDEDGNTITFSNECEAICQGYSPADFIACDDCICPDIWAPVCVLDDAGNTITYGNACEAGCDGYTQEDFVECDDDCICPAIWMPVCVLDEAGNTITYSNACEAGCDGYTPADFVDCEPVCDCPAIWDPVCVNGLVGIITFPNECVALCEGFGPEDFVDCDDDCICPAIWMPVCVLDEAGNTITYGNACEAECDGYTAADFVDCEPVCDCPAIWDPVCVNGLVGIITFPNECEAICEGFDPADFVDCDDDCICPGIWAPVCVLDEAGNTITYGNACEAECDGYTAADFVACDDDCICPDVWAPVCVLGEAGNIITYGNACEAACDGYTQEDFVDCDPTCDCPGIWDPVCVNGLVGIITFPNECVAICEGFSPEDFVDCEQDCNCGTYYLPVCVLDHETGEILTFINPCYAACAGYGADAIIPCDPIHHCWVEFDFNFLSADGLSVQFTDLSVVSGEITSWLWDFGDGATSTEQNPLHNYAEGGLYDVTLVIVSEECGEISETYHLCIGDGGGVGGPDCQGFFFFEQPHAEDLLLFQFIDLSIGDVNAWVWDFGDGNTSTEQNPMHNYAVEGEYIVSLTIFADDCQSTVTMPIRAGEYVWYGEFECRAWFLPVNNPDNNEVFFLNLSSPDAIEFTWDFGDGNTSNNPLALHEYAEAGVYIVTLTIVTTDGCTNSFSSTVYLDTDGFTSSPTFLLLSNTDEVGQLTQLLAAPNPTNGLLRLSWEAQQAGDYSWQLFDINGRLIQENNNKSIKGSTNLELDLSNQASGIYLFRLQTPDGIQTLRLSKF